MTETAVSPSTSKDGGAGPSAVHQQEEDTDNVTKTVAGKVTEVQGDLRFHETVTAAPLNPWSRTSLQLYSILLVAALNATASGFDGVSLSTMFRIIIIFIILPSSSGSRMDVCVCVCAYLVNLQLDKCHEAIRGVLPPHGARLLHGHVSYSVHCMLSYEQALMYNSASS